jgi:glycosyl transferase family 87
VLTAAALALLLATAAFTWSRADDASSWDVPLYQSFGDRIAAGEVPYRDVRIEYPPGALPAFVLPSLVASGEGPVYEPEMNDAARSYARSFAALMTLLLAATVLLTAVSLGALRATVGHAALGLGLVGATPLLLGELALTRFDALPVALTALAVAALVGGRPRLAAVALGAAISAKLYPLLLLPLLAIYVARRRSLREAVVGVVLTAATVAVILVPFVVVSPGAAWFSVRAQLTRGVQVESFPGSVAIALGRAADQVGLGALGVGVDEGGTGAVRSADVTGGLGQVLGVLGGLASVAVVLAVWLAAWRRPDASRTRLVRDLAAVVAAQLALGRVLSPQFVLWLVPLVPLVAGRRGRVASALLAVALVATQAWFPDLYRDYVNERGAFETGYLLLRNALLLGVLAALVWPAAGLVRSPRRATAAKSTNAGATGTA